jgi:hypothetical protein
MKLCVGAYRPKLDLLGSLRLGLGAGLEVFRVAMF